MALSSKQKRAMFKRTFGERLLPDGFAFKGKRFVRLHGEVFLGVEMDLAPSGRGYIAFAAMPFCAGIDREIDYFPRRVEDFGMDYSSIPMQSLIAAPFEPLFDLQYHKFFSEIYDRFAAIQDVRTLLSFQEWKESVLGYRTEWMWMMLEYAQIGDFERARKCAAYLLRRYESARKGYLGKCAHEAKQAKNEAEKMQLHELYGARVKAVDLEIAAIRDKIALMDAGQYEPLLAEIAHNVAISAETVQKFYA